MSYRFEWDEAKARSNRIAHEIGFDEATTVFDDPLARIFDDDLHSVDERARSSSDIPQTTGCFWFVSPSGLAKLFA
jgi:uncharacterized DUF497 family protein